MNTTQFLKPKFILNDEDNKRFMEFNVSQLERGFGVTLGNSLRRTLLSSVPGIAIYAIKITGVSHEFSTIKGVIENTSEIILNIKDIVLRCDDINFENQDFDNLTLSHKGEGTITADAIICPTGIEIVNKDLVIARTTKDNKELNIEFFVKKARGYASFEDNKKLIGNSLGIIAIDANFSPVTKVTYKVEPITKTIKGVDYEKLSLEVRTNGAMTPAEAISFAAKVFYSHLDLFMNLNNEVRKFEVIAASEVESNSVLNLPLEELNLTVRSYNCLKRASFRTLGDIVEKSLDEIAALKNLGSKSVQEIEEVVKKYDLQFSNKN